MRFTSCTGFVVAVVGLACGGSVTLDPTHTGGGGAGTYRSSTNTSPATTASATATTSTLAASGTSTDTATAQRCNGPISIPCPGGTFCLEEGADACDFKSIGTCMPKPMGACPPDCPLVCGCDGATYCSECVAHASGVSVAAKGQCAQGLDGGSSWAFSAGWTLNQIGVFVVLAADWANQRCVRLYVAAVALSTALPGIKGPDGWFVTMAEQTPSAADCRVDLGMPVSAARSVTATSGTGEVRSSTLTFPQTSLVDVHVTLAFPDNSLGLPTTVALDHDAVVLK